VAASGIFHTFLSQRNIKIQAGFALLALVLSLLFGISPIEWALVVLCIMVVISGELFNTALEAVVDLASPEWHELARIAKDVAAGAVLFASLGALVIGMILFLPRIIALM
jgi:diacylglycerol kinase